MAVKKLEYCLGNLDNGSKLLFETVRREFPEIQQQRWGCLGNCAECFKKPFVLIDDRQILTGENPDDLLQKVRDLLNNPA